MQEGLPAEEGMEVVAMAVADLQADLAGWTRRPGMDHQQGQNIAW